MFGKGKAGFGPGKGPVNWVNWFTAAHLPLLTLSIFLCPLLGESTVTVTHSLKQPEYEFSHLLEEEYQSTRLGNFSSGEPPELGWFDLLMGCFGRRKSTETAPECPVFPAPVHVSAQDADVCWADGRFEQNASGSVDRIGESAHTARPPGLEDAEDETGDLDEDDESLGLEEEEEWWLTESFAEWQHDLSESSRR